MRYGVYIDMKNDNALCTISMLYGIGQLVVASRLQAKGESPQRHFDS